MKENKRLRYIFASFFILCGLTVSILGGYECVALKHYEGDVLLGTPIAIELAVAYPGNVIEGQIHLQYDILDTKLLDLSYTTDRGFLWLAILLGLVCTILGIATILKEGLLFRND